MDHEFVSSLKDKLLTPLLKTHGARSAAQLHELAARTETRWGDKLVADLLRPEHFELLLRNMQAEMCDVDCAGGGAARLAAFSRHARALFPLGGAEPVGALLGAGGQLEEEDGLLCARLPGGEGRGVFEEGGGEEEEEEEEGGGGGGGGRPAPAPVSLKREWVIRVGGRASALIGLGAAFAARSRRSASYLANAGPGATVDLEDMFVGLRGGVRKGATATAVAAAAAAAAAKTDSARARGALRYDESAMEAEGSGGGSDGDDEEEVEEECFPRYRWLRKGAALAHFSSVPCGVCPVFEKCSPQGVISPATCTYMSAWLAHA